MKAVCNMGDKFGRMTVVEFVGKSKNGSTLVQCRCDCGKTKIVRLCNLISGATKSCGCIANEFLIQRNKNNKYASTHLKSKTRIYRIWEDIKQRCYNKKQANYKWYGAKGISMCVEWKDSFENFCAWALLNGYNEQLTIDRIDANGNYEPSNCRWVTSREQARNKSSNIYVTINGETKVLKDWCETYCISYATVQTRIRGGWGIVKAIQTPVKHIQRSIL